MDKDARDAEEERKEKSRHALEAGEARAAGLELVKKARHDLSQRQRRAHENPRVRAADLAVDGVPVEVRSAVLVAQVHHHTEELCARRRARSKHAWERSGGRYRGERAGRRGELMRGCGAEWALDALSGTMIEAFTIGSRTALTRPPLANSAGSGKSVGLLTSDVLPSL